ncbi:hypothetical protein AB0C90_03900 [Streptomyces sp. NPDC048550]
MRDVANSVKSRTSSDARSALHARRTWLSAMSSGTVVTVDGGTVLA